MHCLHSALRILPHRWHFLHELCNRALHLRYKQLWQLSKTCALCSSNCKTCSNTLTNCLTCGLISSSQSYLHSDKQCYVICPSGTYELDNGGGNYQCAACPSGCATCDLVSSAVQCTLCTSIAGVQFYLKGTSCVTVTGCGDTYYGGISATF